MCVFHHETLHICFCSIMDHYIYMFLPSWNITYICSIMEHCIYMFVPSWTTTYMCLFHHGTLHIHVCSIMEHYIYVFFPLWHITCMCLFHYGTLHIFVPSWNITCMCLFLYGTLHICVCSIMEHYTVMNNWKWVFVNCNVNKSCISTAAEFLKCQGGMVT